MITRTPSQAPMQCELMRAERFRFHSNGRRFDPYLPSQKKTPSKTGFLFFTSSLIFPKKGGVRNRLFSTH